MTGPVFHWFLPTRGDSTDPGAVPAFGSADLGPGGRAPTLDYLSDVAATAEAAGFDSLLTPVGIGCPDPWVVASAVAARTSRIGFIVAFRPSLASPTLIAQQTATFAATFGGRISLNVVTGGSPPEQAMYGDHSAHDQRYERTADTLAVLPALLRGETVSHAGATVDIRDATLVGPTTPVPIYLGGASAPAEQLAASSVDSYLLWAEPDDRLIERIDRVRGLAQAQGRALRFGLRVHVLARPTAEEAWEETRRIVAGFDPRIVADVQANLAAMDSVGQRRITDLHGGQSSDLVVGQNLWAGIGLVREGVGTAIVGSYEEVAERIQHYRSLGIDEFILSGYPHREEATRFGTHVRPLLERTAAPVA